MNQLQIYIKTNTESYLIQSNLITISKDTKSINIEINSGEKREFKVSNIAHFSINGVSILTPNNINDLTDDFHKKINQIIKNGKE